MNGFENSVISLLKSGICGEKAEINPDVDLRETFAFCKMQKLLPLIDKGIKNSGIEISEKLLQAIEQPLLSYFVIDQAQTSAFAAISEAFEKNCIKYMPLKGTVIKQLYPESYLRPMGDIDILVDLSMEKTIAEIMSSLGFRFLKESAHELIYSNGMVMVELHKCLIPPYNKDYYAYFGDGWTRANSKTGNTYLHTMSDDDNFIYMFVHFAKHYRDGGIGIIHMVDFYVYRLAFNLNEEYIRTELKKLKLLDFYDNIISTLNVWFFDGGQTQITDFITRRMFSNGEFGTKETQAVAGTIKEAAGENKKATPAGNFWRTVFPSAEKMQYSYPVLKKHKCLLPVMWCARGIKILFFKNDRLSAKLNEMKLSTKEGIASYQKELDYVGLSFNFKEK